MNREPPRFITSKPFLDSIMRNETNVIFELGGSFAR